MEETYQILEKLGEGSFGVVTKHMNTQTGELVAIKTLSEPYDDFKQVIKLQEVQSLMVLKHVNIISLYSVIREGSTVHLVFNYVEDSLLKKLAREESIPPQRVRAMAYQLLQGLAYIHSLRIVHRDLKPENILISKDGVIKICDFGLSRSAQSDRPGTTYIATRWYRAPELLLHDASCDFKASDVWACGTVICELYTSKPLFAGEKGAQLQCIEAVLGAPSAADWPQGLVLAARCGFTFSVSARAKDWCDVVPQAPFEAYQMLDEMLSWDPTERCSASDALAFPLFEVSMFK